MRKRPPKAEPRPGRTPLPESRSSGREAFGVAILSALFFLPIYMFSVAPSLGMGHDTGELTTCCVIQGVPHSPGYPLFVCLGWIASQLHFLGSAPYVNNLLCALEVALAVGFLGAALTLATRPLPALVATSLAATSTAIWRQAVLTEVFSLHLLLLSILIWLAILWQFSEDVRRREIVLATSFVLGCCLAHQHIIALAAPSFILFGALARGKGRAWGFSWPNLPVLLGTLCLPYALQAYMADQKPALNWGDPSNFDRLINHFLRRSYGTGLLNAASNQFDERAGDLQVTSYFLNLIRSYFPFPSFLLLLFGLDQMIQTRFRPQGVLFLGLALTYGPIFAILGNQPDQEFYGDLMERFYSSSILGLAGLIALGIDWLLAQRLNLNKRLAPVLLLLPLYQLGLNYAKCSQRGQFQGEDLLAGYLQTLPKRSILVVSGDLPCGVAEYLRRVKNERLDVLILLPGLAGSDWYQERLPVGVAMAARRQPQGAQYTNEVAVENILAYLHKRGYSLWVNAAPPGVRGHYTKLGLIERYLPLEANPMPEAEIASEARRSFGAMERVTRRGEYRLSWKQNYWIRYCILEWIQGYRAIAQALAKSDTQTAIKALDRVIEMETPPSPGSHLDRARLLASQNRLEDAIRDYKICLVLVPQSADALLGMIEVQTKAGHADEAKAYQQQLDRLRFR